MNNQNEIKQQKGGKGTQSNPKSRSGTSGRSGGRGGAGRGGGGRGRRGSGRGGYNSNNRGGRSSAGAAADNNNHDSSSSTNNSSRNKRRNKTNSRMKTMNNSSSMTQQQQQQQQRHHNQQQHTFKRSGEKGAEAHTVSEPVRIQFTKLMLDLRENESIDKIEMPPNLTNTERKFLHQLALQLGLKSKSSGKGDDRRITISKIQMNNKNRRKRNENGNDYNNDDDDPSTEEYYDLNLPNLRLGQVGVKELSRYIQQYPPSELETKEATETGSSLWNTTTITKTTKSNKNQTSSEQQESQNKSQNDDDDDDGDDDGGGDEIIIESGVDNDDVELDDDAGDEIILNALKELKIDSGINNNHHSPSSIFNNKQQQQQQQQRSSSINMKKRKSNHFASQNARKQHQNYQQMQQMRSKLPAFGYQKDICNVIRKNRVTILSGDTGCGKSTQVPQFLLDDEGIGPTCNIVVTQPRRISAISIAERIASERCEDVGKSIGYNVRLETCTSSKTQLMFVTPGVLLRKFQSDPDLLEFSHIIIDEIHERDKYTEFLMIALRELINRRKDLNIVLMSATIQTNELMEYWSSAGSTSSTDGAHTTDYNLTSVDDHRPAEINIPGRTFPVQEFFLEDVLTMTGIVNDSSSYFGNALDEVESNLEALFSQKDVGNKKKGKKDKGNQIQQVLHTSSLNCIMCGMGGFKSPEELGTHVALCTGVGGQQQDLLALEEKVRNVDVVYRSMHEADHTDDNLFEEVETDENDDFEQFDDEESDGLRMGKWDGESPFGVADNLDATNSNTLTIEEMLNRYQTIHDDEQIDNELIVEVMKYICKSSYGDGAILIFLPGWQEISELTMLLENNPPFGDQTQYSILPLHSGIPSKDQRLVFQRPRRGIRKIVLATNIAETSITIDDVAFVIDAGRAKEKNYDPHLKSSTLQPVWISKASAKQRKGRAGRTKAGVCFHLFSRRRHDSLREFLESELLRTSLEEIVLQCKKLHLAPGGPDDDDGVPAFLAAALTPPHPKSVTNALESLVDMGAIDLETNELTHLGHCLSILSLDPRVGKMVIWSYILGCTKEATGMAVAMSYKSPFILPPPSMRRDAENAQTLLSDGTESDQVTILNILNKLDEFHKKGRRGQFYGYCRRNFINNPTINMIADLRKNVARELTQIGFDQPTDLNSWCNRNSNKRGNLAFLQAAIAAGLYPNIAMREAGEMKFKTKSNQSAKIHLSSVNACKGQPLSRKSQMLEFIAFGELVKGVASYTLNQTTHLATIVPILLLCGTFRIRPAYQKGEELSNTSVVSVDEIKYKCEKDSAFALAVLRRRLDDIVEHIVSNPAVGMKNLDEKEWKALATFDAVLNSSFQASPGRY